MLHLRRLCTVGFSYIPVFLLCLMPLQPYALIHKAVFSDGTVVYFKFDDKRNRHHIPLNPSWFHANTGIRVSECDPDELSGSSVDVFTITGGITSDRIHPELSRHKTVRYALGAIKNALVYSGSDQIFNNTPTYNPKTDHLLHIAIDVHQASEWLPLMNRAQTLATSLVQEQLARQWQPVLNVLTQLNRVVFTLTIPGVAGVPGSPLTNDRIYMITQKFLHEFSTHTVQFSDSASPSVFGLSRCTTPIEGDIARKRFPDQVRHFLRSKHLDHMNNLPPPASNAHFFNVIDNKKTRQERFIIHLTIERTKSGIDFLRNTLLQLQSHLNDLDNPYQLHLQLIDRLPSLQKTLSSRRGAISIERIEVVFQLSVLVPANTSQMKSTLLQKNPSLKKKVTAAINRDRDEKIQINHWQPVHIRRESITLEEHNCCCAPWLSLLGRARSKKSKALAAPEGSFVSEDSPIPLEPETINALTFHQHNKPAGASSWPNLTMMSYTTQSQATTRALSRSTPLLKSELTPENKAAQQKLAIIKFAMPYLSEGQRQWFFMSLCTNKKRPK